MFFIEKETDILLILVHVPVQNLQIISMLDGITLRTEILPCDTKIVSHNTNTLNHVFLYDFENPCNFCINLDGKICDFSLMKDQFWNLYLESRLEKGPRGNRNLCDTKYRNSLNKFEPKNLSLETQFDAQTDSYLEFMIESSVSANSSKLYYILLMSQNSFKLSIIDSENKNQKLTLIIPEDMKVFKFKQFRNNLVLALHDYITETIQFRFYKILTPENDLINQFLKNYSLANNVFINYMDYSLKIYPTNLTNIVDYSITDNHIYAICEKNLVFKIKLTDGQNHITVNNSSKSDTNLFGNIISNNYKKFIFTFAYGLDLLGTIQ